MGFEIVPDLQILTDLVEELEAEPADDPRTWARADQLAQRLRVNREEALDAADTPTFNAAAELAGLLTRAEALDLSPSFATERAALAAMEQSFVNRDYAVANRHRAEDMALHFEARAAEENAKPLCDERAAVQLRFLAKRYRDLVFAR